MTVNTYIVFGPYPLCFIVRPFLTHSDCDCGLFRLPDVEIGLREGVTGLQGMLASPNLLILTLVYTDARVSPIL